jgi:hypothetical protein
MKKMSLSGVVSENGQAAALSTSDRGVNSNKSRLSFTTEELRDVFTLHTDELCHTHTLANCECAMDGRNIDEMKMVCILVVDILVFLQFLLFLDNSNIPRFDIVATLRSTCIVGRDE